MFRIFHPRVQTHALRKRGPGSLPEEMELQRKKTYIGPIFKLCALKIKITSARLSVYNIQSICIDDKNNFSRLSVHNTTVQGIGLLLTASDLRILKTVLIRSLELTVKILTFLLNEMHVSM